MCRTKVHSAKETEKKRSYMNVKNKGSPSKKLSTSSSKPRKSNTASGKVNSPKLKVAPKSTSALKSQKSRLTRIHGYFYLLKLNFTVTFEV